MYIIVNKKEGPLSRKGMLVPFMTLFASPPSEWKIKELASILGVMVRATYPLLQPIKYRYKIPLSVICYYTRVKKYSFPIHPKALRWQRFSTDFFHLSRFSLISTFRHRTLLLDS